MNKKIIIGVIIASFVMIGVGLVSAVNTQTKEKQKELEKIDSPLFKIRTGKAITAEKTTVRNKIRNIITNFLENRIFLRLKLSFGENIGLFTSKGEPQTQCSTCQCQSNDHDDSERMHTGPLAPSCRKPECGK